MNPKPGTPPTTPLPYDPPEIETDQSRGAEALAKQEATAELPDGDLDEQFEGLPQEDAEPFYPPMPNVHIYTALAMAQGEFPDIPKNRIAKIRVQQGDPFEFKYSDLADLINAVRPALARNGIAFFQIPSDDLKSCITTLAHISGETLVGSYPIKHKDGSRMHPGQDWSISWAYAKRNALSGILGVASEETVQGSNAGKTSRSFDGPSTGGKLTMRGVTIPAGATKEEIAQLFGTEIERLYGAASSERELEQIALNHQAHIDTLQDHFQPDYDNVVEAYGAAQARLAGERAASSMAKGPSR